MCTGSASELLTGAVQAFGIVVVALKSLEPAEGPGEEWVRLMRGPQNC